MAKNIVRVLIKENFLFASEIINCLTDEETTGQCIRQKLKKIDKFGTVSRVEVNYHNKEKVSRKYPEIKRKLITIKIRRPQFVYFIPPEKMAEAKAL